MTVMLVAVWDAVLQGGIPYHMFTTASRLCLRHFMGRGPQEEAANLEIAPVLLFVSSQGVGS